MVNNNQDLLYKKPIFYATMFGLWALTSFLAIWEILVVRALVVRVFTRVLMNRGGLTQTMATVSAYRAGVVATLIMTIAAIVIILGSADFNYDPNQKRRPWRTMLWILVFQLVVLGATFIW